MPHPLHLCLPALETFNPKTEEFGVFGGIELDLEYSLYTISLWESKWKKPFIETSDKFTEEEKIGFYEAMCITPNVDKAMWGLLTLPIEQDIWKYVTDPMSATTITNHNRRPGRKEIVTTEIIYYWMSSLNIPYSCEHWHFNRLMKLIEVGFVKQAPPKKMGAKEAMAQQKSLNAARKAMWNTKG